MESNDQDPCLHCADSLHLHISMVCWWAYRFPFISHLYKSGKIPHFLSPLLIVDILTHCVAVIPFVLFFPSQTTYENFRYRYDRRANPYNKGVVQNFKEIFCTSISPSKNNFRAKVPREPGLPARSGCVGFVSPNTGKAMEDIEMGRKAVWGDLGAT